MTTAPVPEVAEALRIGVGFLWTAAWAIIMGLVVTSLVQIIVSKERMAAVLGEGDAAGVIKATLFGAASSGCSFGAVAIGKGLFAKGNHAVTVLAFMFGSTTLIVELGLLILVLLGWEFLVAELVGGVIRIAVMAVIVHLTLPKPSSTGFATSSAGGTPRRVDDEPDLRAGGDRQVHARHRRRRDVFVRVERVKTRQGGPPP